MEEGWYREEKIVGLPVNRVQDQLRRKAAVDETKIFLAGMYLNTEIIEEALSWRLCKFQEVEESDKNMSRVSQQVIESSGNEGRITP